MECRCKPSPPAILAMFLATLSVSQETCAENFSRAWHGKIIRQATAPEVQPRNSSGKLVCTKTRYRKGEVQYGVASWYGNEFHGRKTASGEIYNENADTFAHLSLPPGTIVLVENLDTGKSAYARVNDCGPYKYGRIADFSKGLAKKLGFQTAGLARVLIYVL